MPSNQSVNYVGSGRENQKNGGEGIVSFDTVEPDDYRNKTQSEE
jgi:hypothetical protein